MRGARLIGMMCDFIGSVSVSEGLERGRPRKKVGNPTKKNIKSSMVFSNYLNKPSLVYFSCFHA